MKNKLPMGEKFTQNKGLKRILSAEIFDSLAVEAQKPRGSGLASLRSSKCRGKKRCLNALNLGVKVGAIYRQHHRLLGNEAAGE